MGKERAPLIFPGATTADVYYQEYQRYLSNLLSGLDYKELDRVTQLLLEKARNGQTIFLIGNGGSAATASHFAIDLTECSRPEEGLYFRALSLTDNVPILTALGNDEGYEEIFSRQLQVLFRKNDVLIAISASGNSPNVIAGIHIAKKLGGTTVGLVGFDGGELAKICDYVIHVSTNKDEYGPVEDIHLVIDHMVTSYLRARLSGALNA